MVIRCTRIKHATHGRTYSAHKECACTQLRSSMCGCFPRGTLSRRTPGTPSFELRILKPTQQMFVECSQVPHVQGHFAPATAIAAWARAHPWASTAQSYASHRQHVSPHFPLDNDLPLRPCPPYYLQVEECSWLLDSQLVLKGRGSSIRFPKKVSRQRKSESFRGGLRAWEGWEGRSCVVCCNKHQIKYQC